MRVTLKVTKEQAVTIVTAMRIENDSFYGLVHSRFGLTRSSSDNGVVHQWVTSGDNTFMINSCELTATYIGTRHGLIGKWFKELHDNEVLSYVTEAPYLKWYETNDELKKTMKEFLSEAYSLNCTIEPQLRYGKFKNYPEHVLQHMFDLCLTELKEEFAANKDRPVYTVKPPIVAVQIHERLVVLLRTAEHGWLINSLMSEYKSEFITYEQWEQSPMNLTFHEME